MSELELRIQTVCLLVLSVVAGAAALYWLQPVMIPFVLSVFVALGLAAAADAQVRYLRFPRVLALVSTLVIALVGFTLVGALVSTSVGQLAANAEAYQARITELLERASAALPLDALGLNAAAAREALSEIPVGAVGGVLGRITNAILDILSRSLLVLIFVIYLVLGITGQQLPSTGVRAEIEVRVKRYLVTKAGVSMATGALVGGLLALLNVELALVFGLLAFLLNFIPSVGSVIATLLPLPVVLLSPESTGTTIALAIAGPAAIQVIIGNVIEPKIMGDSLELHPITILMALIFWGMLWGIVGMLLATPITAVARILFERLEITRPIANILAGKLD